MHENTRANARISATASSHENQTTHQLLQPRDGVLVLTGYGLRIAVERGHLAISDGIGDKRRSGRLHRATSRLTRLVVLGHSGTISFEALRWLHDIGASLLQIDADGTVIVASGPAGLDDARLRRAQALAASNGTGIAIATIWAYGRCVAASEFLRPGHP